MTELSVKTMHKRDLGCSGLYRISKVLIAPASLEIKLANVINTLPAILPMRRGAIVGVSAEGQLEITATSGIEHTSSGVRYMPAKAAIERIVTKGAPLVVPDTYKSELFQAEIETFSSGTGQVTFIGVPMKVNQETLGTLWIDRAKDGSTRTQYEEEVRFLSMVGNLVAGAIRLDRDHSRDGQQVVGEEADRKNSSGGKELPEPVRQRPARIDWIVGESPALRQVIESIEVVARTNSTVLLRGESGTGKEFFARAIHELSPRRKKSFVKLNCAALSAGVLESELFGHEKGAFTGAISQRAGRFELADGGTLLLDEIGEISPAFQAKLLRVLQEGELERVGGTKTLKVDVRLICATNKDLETAVASGEFRADLYYRINVVPIILPPLRERNGDIPRLARVFLDRFNRENDCDLAFAPPALDLMSKCDFPGNVRELENCVRRTATLARSRTIVPADFACQNDQCFSSTLWKSAGRPVGGHASSRLAMDKSLSVGPPVSLGYPNDPGALVVAPHLTDRELLISAMEKAGWVQAKAARLLGLTPRQVGYALRRHHIQVKKI
ncbi:nif-specific transcriptional activator NifA [Sinorhizobium sp. 7-81]|uniref:nif-specific transcriptional activator NifA n=1 Tax=Sinorhizobium sp. 8-89 TaxID=3049089 RepID=UPI0024C314F3|nr:nif-specific transcriptional activator NifA [Sinorhizobium sp. 8-89]MDK1493582.1 nif-specific transcriptional activator NifA [Sinorhizobium sp. 8-89]